MLSQEELSKRENASEQSKVMRLLRAHLADTLNFWGNESADEDVGDFKNVLKEQLNSQNSFKLYRYTPPSYHNIRNLEKQMIHLSSNGVMNDIQEGIPLSVIQCLTHKDTEILGKLASMTCFSEVWNNQLMWGHYADSHRGFCVEYDLTKLKNDPFKIVEHIYPVLYGSQKLIARDIPSLIESCKALFVNISECTVYDGDESLDDIVPLFLTKGTAWEYEREWRIIYSIKQQYDMNDEQLYIGNIPFECVSGVFLGYRAEKEVRENIIEICHRMASKANTVPVYQERVNTEDYELDFEQISE